MTIGSPQPAAFPDLPGIDFSRLEGGAHVLQFYEDEAFLVDAAARFVGAALGGGDAAVIIATSAHQHRLDAVLHARGLDLTIARAESRYVTLDASATLAKVMVDGTLDGERFREVIGGAVRRAGAGLGRRVHAFGEMVTLLWNDGRREAALALEALCSELASQRRFSILCAYPIGVFGRPADEVAFQQICREHSAVVPAESYTALNGRDERLRAISRLQQQATALEAGIARRREAEDATVRALIDASPLPIVVIEPDATVRLWNPSAERVFGWSASEVIGRPMPIAPADKAVECQSVRDALAHGSSFAGVETRRLRRDGSIADVLISAAPLVGEDGATPAMVFIFEDVTDRKRAEHARGRLAAIVESSDDAIIGKSLDGIVTSWNGGAERLFGYSAAEMIGQPLVRLVPPDRHDDLPKNLNAIRRGERVEHFETERMRKSGERIHVSLTVSPIRDAAGRIVGASKIARDVTERKRAEAELEALLRASESAQAAAEAANRSKDEFLAMLGHELRNPLGALQNAIITARLDPTRREHALEIARRQSEQLGRLVEDLLDVARITHGRIALRKERVSVQNVIARAVENVRSLVDDQGHRLTVSLSSGDVDVEADPSRLEQVLVNLLTNAAKYTEPGGRIEVTAELAQGEVAVCVRDNGVGIPADVLTRIFDLFAQGDRTLDRSLGGLGIGLTVARRLVELHGGRIEAHSVGRGKGAEFIVRLPALGPVPAEASAAASPEPGPSPCARVLMVEDNPDGAESLKMLLELLGHRVRVTHDGVAALAAARANCPDIMLVDIGLPGMDGYEVARQVRQEPALKHVVLVALTGYGRDEDKQRALAAGFDYHLVKPVDVDALEKVVARLGRPDEKPPLLQ
jgi:PAS domain S-box-containing protein